MKKSVFVVIFLLSLIRGFAFELIEGEFDESIIYPMTTHRYMVSIPDGHDGSEACLYVGLDGILCNAPARIDSLIATGDLPRMIGIFVEPGIIRGRDGTIFRYNRSNEFDAIDSRFAYFLADELIPHILRTVNSDGRCVRFKSGADNTMIFGLSSGGIAAFVAAWHKPEIFGKVFSGCGTFVPMRGGNELQALVRKSEPRRIKVFLQDGYSDSWNPLFGSWFEANAMLGTALEFAGYECKFDWAEGEHSVSRSNEIFSDVLKWLWCDYPKAMSDRLSRNSSLAVWLKDAGDWEDVIPGELSYSEGFAVYPDSTLCARQYTGSNYLWQYLISTDGTEYAGQPFYWLHNYKNSELQIGAMEFDGDGNLWVLTDAGIQICDQNGRVRGILRLPTELDDLLWSDSVTLQRSGIKVSNGGIMISVGDKAWHRVLNTTEAHRGVRPVSQGQG